MANPFLAQTLAGLSQGLMAAGSGGWQNFAPGFSQGLMGAQQYQYDKMDREERRRLRELQEQQLQMQVEQQRTANQDAVAQKQAWEKYIGQGMMSPNGMSQAQFGGAPQNQMAPGLMEQFTPEQLSFLKTLPPEQGMSIVGQQMFKEAGGAPETTGGFYWDQTAKQFVPIPGYEDQQKNIRAAGKSVTNVQNNLGPTGIDYGDPGPGLVWQRDQQNNIVLDTRGAPIAIPFQGGPAYIEAEKAGEAKETKETEKQKTADIVSEDIGRVFDTIDSSMLPTTGFLGNMLSSVGGTAANDVRALVDTIQANVGFDKLQAMRASSPTGGALGSITERELALLSSVLGNLEQSQSEPQLKENLARLEEVYLDIIHGKGNRPEGWQPRNVEKKRVKYNPETGKLE